MCGRYAITLPPDAMAQMFDAQWRDGPPNLAPCWNVAPTTERPVMALGRAGRSMLMMRWGLVPSWAKDLKALPLMINARAETVKEKPAFRTLWRKRRRCLVPADGFYEWTPKDPAKQPWHFRRRDGQPMVFGGLWDYWESGDGALLSFAIVSTDANATMRPVHHRCPVVLEQGAWDRWLEEDSPDDLLAPPGDEVLVAHRVSKAVNAVRNDSAALVEPLAV